MSFFLVEHRDARAGERHQLVGHQVDEQVRHRAVQALEGEPSKVARAGADTTQWHLGHALCSLRISSDQDSNNLGLLPAVSFFMYKEKQYGGFYTLTSAIVSGPVNKHVFMALLAHVLCMNKRFAMPDRFAASLAHYFMLRFFI